MNFKELKSSLSSRVIRDSRKFTPRVKVLKEMKQQVGFQVKQKVGRRFFKLEVLSFCFHSVGSEEKVIRMKRKLVSLCLGIVYLALGISNPVGAKLSRWHFGINSFGANWDLRRNCTQRGHCLAGAKLSRWYLGIISSWRQLGST